MHSVLQNIPLRTLKIKTNEYQGICHRSKREQDVDEYNTVFIFVLEMKIDRMRMVMTMTKATLKRQKERTKK